MSDGNLAPKSFKYIVCQYKVNLLDEKPPVNIGVLLAKDGDCLLLARPEDPSRFLPSLMDGIAKRMIENYDQTLINLLNQAAPHLMNGPVFEYLRYLSRERMSNLMFTPLETIAASSAEEAVGKAYNQYVQPVSADRGVRPSPKQKLPRSPEVRIPIGVGRCFIQPAADHRSFAYG